MKGEAKGFFYPENVDSKDPQEIAAWAYRQFLAISAMSEFAITRRFEKRNSEPKKPRDGDAYLADGIGWNPDPTQGAGIYCWYNNRWNRIGSGSQ